MPRPRKEIDFDKIYESKCNGPFKILNEEPYIRTGVNNNIQRRVRIRFINTGTERIVNLGSALNGSVRDVYAPTVYGVGYLGEVANTEGSYSKKEYDIWFHMISICYCKSDPRYHSCGGIGVTVDPEWHNFTNFLIDLPSLLGYNEYINTPDEEKNKWHLDKDFLQKHIPCNQRVYSKYTCILIKGSSTSRVVSIEAKEGSSSPYFGVYRNPDGRTFQSSITVDGIKYFLGTYDNEIAAASIYNFVASRCTYSPTTNSNIVFMDIKEALSHRITHKPLVLPPQINTSVINIIPTQTTIVMNNKDNIRKPVEMCRIVNKG